MINQQDTDWRIINKRMNEICKKYKKNYKEASEKMDYTIIDKRSTEVAVKKVDVVLFVWFLGEFREATREFNKLNPKYKRVKLRKQGYEVLEPKALGAAFLDRFFEPVVDPALYNEPSDTAAFKVIRDKYVAV